MSLLISVLIAVVLVVGLGYAAPYLPFNELLGGGFYQIAAIVLAIVISVFLNLPMLYMLRANSAYSKGKFKSAVELYKKAYKTNRLSVDMEIYCAYIFLKEGEKELSGQIFEKLESKKLDSRQQNSFDTNKAIYLWKTGDINSAIKLLQNVWDRAPSVTVAGTLGALMLVKARQEGDYSQALKFCESTNEQYTYEKTILANLGEAYYSTEQNDKALKTFEELMDCGTSSPAPLYYYALALLKANRNDEGEEMLERALHLRYSRLSTISKKTVKAKLDEIQNNTEE